MNVVDVDIRRRPCALVDMPEVDPDAVGLVTFHQLAVAATTGGDDVAVIASEEDAAEAGVEEGQPIAGRVLDVSRREGVVDIGARPALVTGVVVDAAGGKGGNKKGSKAATTKAPTAAALKKRRAAAAAAGKLPVGTKVIAEVELVKPEYAVLSLPDHGGAVGYAPVHHLNRRYADPAERFQPLQRVHAVVAGNAASGSPGGRLLLTVPLLGSGGGGGGGGEAGGGGEGGVGDGSAAEHVGAGVVLEGVVREVQAMQAVLTLPNGRRGGGLGFSTNSVDPCGFLMKGILF